MSRDVLATLQSIGALKHGHFLFSSGRHGDVYLEKFDLFRNPVATSDVCTGFVERFRAERIDVVAGPTTGGILMAFETARQLGVAAAFAERASETGTARAFRRGTTFAAGSRVLILDDILTTGGSVRETLAALEPHPVEVVAVGVLVDRSGGTVDLKDVPLFALATEDITSWDPNDCPLCRNGEPITRPGTTTARPGGANELG